MKKYAVIVAGGSGLRMGTPTPKQFLQLQGKPVLWYTVAAFIGAYADVEVILVVPAGHIAITEEIVREFGGRVRLVTGGKTRFHSVQNGLQLVDETSVVFVHDGVRCLVSKELVHRCYEQALKLGSAIPAVSSRDSVRLVTPEGSEAIDRSRVKLIQTPQTFLSSILLPAYQAEYRESFTDEATVVEAAGHTLYFVEGETNNIKITVPADLIVAESYLLQ
jgi:2-C-methyl-D-erythritol 4-phosphate cytidylyltransferase